MPYWLLWALLTALRPSGFLSAPWLSDILLVSGTLLDARYFPRCSVPSTHLAHSLLPSTLVVTLPRPGYSVPFWGPFGDLPVTRRFPVCLAPSPLGTLIGRHEHSSPFWLLGGCFCLVCGRHISHCLALSWLREGGEVSSDRSGAPVAVGAIVAPGTAGREGTLTSREQDVGETPSCTYLPALRDATRGRLSAILGISVGIRIWPELENLVVIRVSRKMSIPILAGVYRRWHLTVFG